MSKLFKTIPFVAIAVMISTAAMGAGTANNWKLSLQFKMGSAVDTMPVVVGTGGSSEEILKPPPMPGKDDTGSSGDAYVRAYIKATGKKENARAIDVVNKNIWAIEIDAEEAGQSVSVDIDTTDFYPSYYPFTLVIPGAAEPVKDIRSASGATNLSLFTSDGSPKTVYLVAGSTKSFAAASGVNGEIIGVVDTPGIAARAANAEVELFTSSPACNNSLSPVKTTTTDSNGLYSLDGVSAGNYVIKVDKPYHLASECTINIDAQGTSETACNSVYSGDLNNDGNINLFDLGRIKPYYNKSKAGYPDWTSNSLDNYDLNSDENINIYDIAVFKSGYGKSEPSCAN